MHFFQLKIINFSSSIHWVLEYLLKVDIVCFFKAKFNTFKLKTKKNQKVINTDEKINLFSVCFFHLLKRLNSWNSNFCSLANFIFVNFIYILIYYKFKVELFLLRTFKQKMVNRLNLAFFASTFQEEYFPSNIDKN